MGVIAALGLGGCPAAPPARSAALPAIAVDEEPGLTITYDLDGVALVDERRWVDVGASFEVDRIDRRASLAGLVIESASDRDGLRIGRCMRSAGERVRCEVAAGAGRHLIRTAYTIESRARGDHQLDVALHPDATAGVTVTRSYLIDTPAWNVAADVVVIDGGDVAIRERGTMNGDTARIAVVTAIEAPARIETVFRGAIETRGESPREPGWHAASTGEVWEWIEIDIAPSRWPRGSMSGRVRPADAAAARPIAIAEIERHGERVRARLWAVAELRGSRAKIALGGDRFGLGEELVFMVSSSASEPRDVVIEEALRPARRRRVMKAWPTAPVLRGDVLRTRVRVGARSAVRTGYVVEYLF